jgi:hypothetical protein
MDKTVQTNVRVVETDRVVIINLAQRLRTEAGFRDRLRAFLEDDSGSALADRVKNLEQQVSYLLSGAIVVPRSNPRVAAPPPRRSLPKSL